MLREGKREAAAAMCEDESMSRLSTRRENDEGNQIWKLKKAEAKEGRRCERWKGLCEMCECVNVCECVCDCDLTLVHAPAIVFQLQ